jgi:pimeloyl-ACP methyl ester carboxylesterase
MHYNVTGDGDPVVLITGFAGSTAFWNNMLPLLPDNKVITLDNRGAGLTEYKGPFDTDVMADDVIALMDHLSVHKAHIVGWSMGTTIAHRIALRYTKRVSTLTFISPYSKRPARSSYIANAAIRAVKEGADFDVFSMILNAFCFGETAFTSKEKKGSKMKLPAHTAISGIEDQMREVDAYDGRARIKDIPFGTLVIHGTEDVMVPPWIAETIASAIKGSRLVMVPGSGHIIHPDRYIGHLKEHISPK